MSNNTPLNMSELAMGLYALMTSQIFVGQNAPDWFGGDRGDFIRTSVLSCMVELTELLQLTDWKHWKSPPAVTVSELCEEFADVLAFLGYIIVYLHDVYKITPMALTQAYADKTTLNIARLRGEVSGYGNRGGGDEQAD